MFLHLFTVFLGAFLLFQVQPLIGKYILPWFGGAPSVWATCLLFFQVLLLGGYAYAHLLSERLSARRQGLVHLGLVLLSVGLLAGQAFAWATPILPGASFKPEDSGQPVGRILILLTLGVGLPYLLLASTSPLVQAWFHRAFPERSPYRLYVLSNVGSMLALLSYPFLIEPSLRLSDQARVWGSLYVVFALGVAWLALRIRRSRLASEADASGARDSPPPEPPGWRRCLLWLALAACASTMLLAVTNEICQEVAVIPFLWVLPLAIYLLSFILTFESKRWYSRRVFGLFFILASLFVTIILFRGREVGILTQVLLYSYALFIGCMICHGELVGQKPHPRHLTSFYLMVSLGGALGGVFVALVAPLIFNGYWELHLSLFICAYLLFVLADGDPKSWFSGSHRRKKRALAVVLLIGLAAVLYNHVQAAREASLVAERDFYGVTRVDQTPPQQPNGYYALVHGKTIHGMQAMAPEARQIPMTYYGNETGGGMAFTRHPRRGAAEPSRRSLRAGIIGLGVGTLAAYGQAGDVFRFYEINPQVVEFARGAGGYFSYLADSLAETEVLLGDGRLLLERERDQGRSQDYDILVVDAFSSDSIPVHLLTVEAFDLYFHHLKPDGILALHLSNKALCPEWVAIRLAAHFEMPLIAILNKDRLPYTIKALWVLITRNEEFIEQVAADGTLVRPDPDRQKFPASLWTDDFSNLFEILY